MDELKKKRNIRGGHRAFATQLIRQIEDSLEDQLKLKQLEIQLDEKFEVLGKLDDEILDLVSEIDEDGLGCLQEISEAGEMKEKINLALLKLKSLVKNEKQLESRKPNLTRHGSEESVYSVESSASSATRKVRAKLPKLELKKFSGRPQDWQEFWDSYKSAVYENEEISKIDKFSYLKHYLEEPAKKVIAGLALTEKNYDVAVDLLEQRFARPTTIKRAHINELLNLDAVFNEKHVKKMRELYDTIETHHRGLKALEVDEISYSNIVVPVLMDKVPEAVRLNMIRGSKNHQEWDMEEMLVAFREELEIREQHVSISMALGNGTVSGRTSSERRSEMKPRFPGRTTTASALFTKQDGGFPSANQARVKTADTTVTTSCVSNIDSGGRAVLQTAKAVVTGNIRDVKARVLFDSGSQRSFVTRSMVEKLGLNPIKQVRLGIKTFGSQNMDEKIGDVVELELKGVESGGKLIRQIEDSLEDQLKLKQLKIQLDEKFEVLGKLDDEILDLVSEIDEDGLGCLQEISEAGEMKEKINLALLKLKSLVKNEKQLESRKPNLTRHGSEESVYSVESSASSATRKVRAKLPKLELKKFSGRPQDWQEFWDSYKSAVYENEEISKIDKFSYLKHYLEEPAKKVIAGLALTEKNYDVAVDLLEQRFARPTTIKRAHINELLNLDAVFNEKHVKKMRELYDTIETHHRGLKALGVDETSYSNIVVPVLMDKVPEAVRLYMIRGSKNHQEWDMEEMLVAFREELEIREQHVSISMALGNGTVSGRTSSERRSEMKPRFPGRTTTASALFTKQDGSQRSFVTRSMVEKLGLNPIKQVRLGIKTFGSQNMSEKIRDVVELELKGVESGGKVKIQAFVVNEVSEIRNEHVEILKLKGQLKKLKEKPAIMETYDGIIKQQEKDRIIEEVTSLEPSEKLSYLPHHAVVRNDAETTKDL
eukprot:gene8904-biopygen10482